MTLTCVLFGALLNFFAFDLPDHKERSWLKLAIEVVAFCLNIRLLALCSGTAGALVDAHPWLDCDACD